MHSVNGRKIEILSGYPGDGAPHRPERECSNTQWCAILPLLIFYAFPRNNDSQEEVRFWSSIDEGDVELLGL
jgi:hypothetical protein